MRSVGQERCAHPHLGELPGEISRLWRGGDPRARPRRQVGTRGGIAVLDGAGGDDMITDPDYDYQGSETGSPYWMAPEVITP